MNDDLSRRDLLKRVGLAGAAAAVPGDVLAQVASARAPLETLTPAEADTLDAIVARLVPTDATGPGATEAKAARYIDRALGGALAPFRDAYRAGLAAVDAYARASKGAPFAKLSAQNQDAVLTDMEMNAATGFTPGSAAFFNVVLGHTIQGTFCDPFYGGNDRFVGWDLIGYPGIRLAAAASDQSMHAPPSPTHMSAYDFTMFGKKKPARALLTAGDDHHGG
jgi:gluconate 2-dehydrogenase gamma chain